MIVLNNKFRLPIFFAEGLAFCATVTFLPKVVIMNQVVLFLLLFWAATLLVESVILFRDLWSHEDGDT